LRSAAIGRPDHVYVWTSYARTKRERLWLHKTAQAYALSEEQGWTIERRRKETSMLVNRDDGKYRRCV